MIKLSVNINKVALIRNSRRGNKPDLLQFAIDCERFGADGITVHPRPDERHIRYSDLIPLMEANATEFNIEGYPSDEFLDKVISVGPHQCTLVPDPPGVLTSDSGWDIKENRSFLTEVINRLKEHSIRTSVFIDPDPDQVKWAKIIGADRVELYTGDYAKKFKIDRVQAIKDHKQCSIVALDSNIGLNAGHDLDLENLHYYGQQLIALKEVSIGHALITDALYYGIHNTIGMYKQCLSK